MDTTSRYRRGLLLVALLTYLGWWGPTESAVLAQKKKPRPKRVVSQGIKANQRANVDARSAIKVAPVDPARRPKVEATAAKIDKLIESHLEFLQMAPNPMTTDEQFLRRVYLDITGTIPTHKQAVAFLDSDATDKRAKLIDRLLNSPGYVSHMYNYWANIMRIKDRPQNNVIGEPFIEWIKQSLADNRPYDEWVFEMLTAEGKIWDNPAVGYTMRDGGMPLDAMNNTVRVFLGTQIGCAQCHDHPFDKWKQRQFYELAAYSYGVKTRRYGINLNKLRMELKKVDRKNKGNGTFARIVRANGYNVWENKNLKLKLPHDYAYEDAKPGDVVKPEPIFGQTTKLKAGASPRKVFAQWITAPDNPRFTGNIANRLWKRAMGAGLIEPVDDIRDDSRPENRPLMGLLVTELKELDFNTKEYLRILYNTRTYQRQVSTEDIAEGQVYHFPGPKLRRMSAEQVWDSLLTLTVYNPDSIRRPSTKGMAQIANLDPKPSARQVLEKSKQFDEQFGANPTAKLQQQVGYKGYVLARASELRQPGPAYQFLRQFGQGDRELISGASTQGTVPQILTMFNGPITHMMLEKGSVIFDNVVNANGTKEKVDMIFLSILSRRPTVEERLISVGEISRLRKIGREGEGFGNVIWALANTREFLFIQ